MKDQSQNVLIADLDAEICQLNLNSPGELSETIALALEKLYPLSQQVSHWQLAHYAAAESWLVDYRPRVDATGLEQVRGYLEAFHHCCEVEAWEVAWQILQIPVAPQQQLLHEQLSLWGYYQISIDLYSRLLNKLSVEVSGICLCGLAVSYRAIGEIKQAIFYGKELLKKENILQDQSLIVRAFGCLANAYRTQGSYRISNDFYQTQLQAASCIHNVNLQIQSLCGLARLDVINLKYKQAETYLKQALILSKIDRSSSLNSHILNELGNLYSTWGKYQLAIKYLKIEEKISRNLENSEQLEEIFHNLGSCYLMLGQHKKALTCFEKSLKLAQNSDNRIFLGSIFNSIGILYCFHLDQAEAALSYLEQALAYAQSVGDLRIIAHEKVALSGCLGKIHRYQEALDYAQEAQQTSREFGYRQVEALAMGAIANAHWHNGHPFLGLWTALKMFLIWQPWRDANGQLMLRVFLETVGSKLRLSALKKAKA